MTLLSDPSFRAARAFRSYDDFEYMELHSTFILDREGRVHWPSIGGEPYTDFDHLESQITLLNADQGPVVADAKPVEASTAVDGAENPEAGGP